MKSKVIFLMVSFLFLMFCYPVISSAQVGSSTNATKKKFSKGLIIKKDRKRFEGTNLVFDSQSLIFKNVKTSQSVTIPLSEIQYVKANVSTHAMEGALIGGGIFLLSALAALADVASDPYTEVENGGQVVAITTAIGFGGGLFIGAMFPKEKIVYKRGRFYADKNILNTNRDFKSSKNIPFLSLQLSF